MHCSSSPQAPHAEQEVPAQEALVAIDERHRGRRSAARPAPRTCGANTCWIAGTPCTSLNGSLKRASALYSSPRRSTSAGVQRLEEPRRCAARAGRVRRSQPGRRGARRQSTAGRRSGCAQLEPQREALRKVDLEPAALASRATICSAASSAPISAGIGKSFCAVSGVSTKPGLTTDTPMPCGFRSRYSVSARLISAALVGP